MVLCMRKVLIRSVRVLSINGITAVENVTEKIAILWHIMAIFEPYGLPYGARTPKTSITIFTGDLVRLWAIFDVWKYCLLRAPSLVWPPASEAPAPLAVFGPNILIFMGVSKSFGTNITENHLDNLSALFFGQALDKMSQNCWYLAQNARFWPNLAVFGPKIQFFGGRE